MLHILERCIIIEYERYHQEFHDKTRFKLDKKPNVAILPAKFEGIKDQQNPVLVGRSKYQIIIRLRNILNRYLMKSFDGGLSCEIKGNLTNFKPIKSWLKKNLFKVSQSHLSVKRLVFNQIQVDWIDNLQRLLSTNFPEL